MLPKSIMLAARITVICQYWWLSFKLWNLSFTSLVISCITCTWKAFPYNLWLCQPGFSFFFFFFVSSSICWFDHAVRIEMHHWGGRVDTFWLTIGSEDYFRMMFSHHLVVTCWKSICVLWCGVWGFFFIVFDFFVVRK